jgi:preprotein translocase subunit SecF
VLARRETLARKAAQRDLVDGGHEAIDLSDDESLETELRTERAMAAASTVPVRNPKASDAKRSAARSGRPSGKKRH